jgi:hypothetical protein
VIVALILAGLGRVGGDSAPPEHWAYRPPTSGPLPAPAFPGWGENPIDLFVGARLAREGLVPAPPATPSERLRRASLDLTGLPPTLEELAAFEGDAEPGAFERALERLFASPHYGEHQATRWLDLARYADTRGYEKDDRREMWRYRDWVIEAYQRDLPFDRFTLEQLAGDLLAAPTLDQLVATGFHRNTLVNEEGGIDPEEFRVAAVKDRVNTTALVWLGTTLECAQCHDHKYDPLTQEDYYRFYAFFDGTEDVGNSDAPAIPAPTRAFEARAEELRDERAGLEGVLTPEATAEERERWRGAWAAHASDWRVLEPERFESRAGSRLAVLADDSLLAFGPLPSGDAYSVEAALPSGTLAALRLEVLTDPSLPQGGPGRPEHQNFVLTHLAATLDGHPLELREPRADYHQDGYGPSGILDDDPHSGWAVGGAVGEGHALVFELEAPVQLPAPGRIALTLEQDYGGGHLIGRLRVAWSAVAPPALGPVPSPRIAERLDSRADEDAQARAAWFAQRSPAFAPVRERLSAIARELVPPSALVMRERPEGRATHLQRRGNFLTPGEAVTPGTPHALPPLASDAPRPSRLDLARWLCAPENPLTARVVVNRLWQRLFGTGLVATENDFGTRGERPSHPELLDWLALEFQRRGWSHRELLRLVLTSATYAQSSRVTPELLARDPGNRWLARGPKLRLEAENLRDSALAIAGLLDRTVGGPSVFPPQPEGIWQSPYSGDRWTESIGGGRHRRGLYTFLKRSAPYPTLLLFDATSRELACSRRGASNTPLQALALLNDPAFAECAEALARRMLSEGGTTDRARLSHGFRLCTARTPDEYELAVLERLLRGAAPEPGAARAESEPGVPPEWRSVATVLLNLDETLTKG